ncbi:MAG TPA: acylphosphatase [Gemmatimonadales bacterium]|nr:acylphosphatase [Gemmatimonadales bacterium]
MRTQRFIVSGRVQGVGFRWFVLQQARRLDVGGYARNRADGTVEVVASGNETALVRLEELLRSGPDLANVTDVVSEVLPRGEPFSGFEVRRG